MIQDDFVRSEAKTETASVFGLFSNVKQMLKHEIKIIW